MNLFAKLGVVVISIAVAGCAYRDQGKIEGHEHVTTSTDYGYDPNRRSEYQREEHDRVYDQSYERSGRGLPPVGGYGGYGGIPYGGRVSSGYPSSYPGGGYTSSPNGEVCYPEGKPPQEVMNSFEGRDPNVVGSPIYYKQWVYDHHCNEPWHHIHCGSKALMVRESELLDQYGIDLPDNMRFYPRGVYYPGPIQHGGAIDHNAITAYWRSVNERRSTTQPSK